MDNIFSVDLESHSFTWQNMPGSAAYYEKEKLKRNTKLLLSLLDEFNVKATFFTLGRIAEELPGIVIEIFDAGHEIASHGYDHKRVDRMSPDEFKKDIEKTQNAVFKVTGRHPSGFRAPEFSMKADMGNYFAILKDSGFLYDSSIYPISLHPGYGDQSAPGQPFLHPSGLIEFPMSYAEVAKLRIPCSGGAYLRHYPFTLFRILAAKCIEQGRQYVFYAHPWEIGEIIQDDSFRGIQAYRRFHNIDKVYRRIRKLLYGFKFHSFIDHINKTGAEKWRINRTKEP